MFRRVLFVSATLLVCTTTAVTSFADDAPASPPSAPAPAPAASPSGGDNGGATATPTDPPTTTTSSSDPSSEGVGLAPATSAPAPLPRETVAVYHRERPHKVLLITGAALAITTYALTASFAGAGQRAADRDLFVPLAGPFMNASNRNCSRGCTTDTRDTALILTSGIVQLIGVGLMITSAFVPNKVAAGRISAGGLNMHVAPTAAPGGGGIGAVGTF